MYKIIVLGLLIAILVVVSDKTKADCEPTLWETSADVHKACARGLLSQMQCDTWIPEITQMQGNQKIMDEVSNAVLQYQDDWAKKTVTKTLRMSDE